MTRVRRSIGIKLSHYKKSGIWYLHICRCVFFSKDNNYAFDLSKIRIDETYAQEIIDATDAKGMIKSEYVLVEKYQESDQLDYYGSSDVSKVHKTEQAFLQRMKERNAKENKNKP